MATLINTLESTEIKDLIRAYYSQKNYLHIKVSVFNAGVSIQVICTDAYKHFNPRFWNGNDFCVENDATTKYYIVEALNSILGDFTINKTDLEIKKINQVLNDYY